MRLIVHILSWSWFLLFFSCGKKDGPRLNTALPFVLADTLVTEEHLKSGKALLEVRPGDQISVTLRRWDDAPQFHNYQRESSYVMYSESRGRGHQTARCHVDWRDFQDYRKAQKMPGDKVENLPLKIKLGDNLYPFEELAIVSKKEMSQKAFFWVRHYHLQSGNQLSLVLEQPNGYHVRVGFTGGHSCNGRGGPRENTHNSQQYIQHKINLEMQLVVRGVP